MVVPCLAWCQNRCGQEQMKPMKTTCVLGPCAVLLIEDGDKLILIDNGIGNKQDAKFFSHFYLHGDASLDGSLKKAGFSPNDVTDMFQTHLHFDHCGGGVDYANKDQNKFQLHFPNAKYWTQCRPLEMGN